MLQLLGLVTSEPPPSAEPGAALASDPQRSRATGHAVGPLLGADRPPGGESTGGRESSTQAPGGRIADRATRDRQVSRARSPDPRPAGPICMDTGADRSGGEASEEARLDFEAASADGPGSSRDPAFPSHLGAPLIGRPGGDRPVDRRGDQADTEEHHQRGRAAASGGSLGPHEVSSRSALLDSPMTEVRCPGRELTACSAGTATGEGTGVMNDVGRVGSRTSSAPPCHRRDRGGNADLSDARHLAGAEGGRDLGGADDRPHQDGPVNQPGGVFALVQEQRLMQMSL